MRRAIGVIIIAVTFAIVDILFIPSIDIPWSYLFVVAFLAIGWVSFVAFISYLGQYFVSPPSLLFAFRIITGYFQRIYYSFYTLVSVL